MDFQMWASEQVDGCVERGERITNIRIGMAKDNMEMVLGVDFADGCSQIFKVPTELQRDARQFFFKA